MEYLFTFLIYFIVVFIGYYFVYVRKAKRENKRSSEVTFLINYYKLDVKKFSYKKFLTVVTFTVAFDVSLVGVLVPLFQGLIWQILIGFVVIIPVAVVSFIIVGNYYKNKQTKDNSKELEKEKKFLKRLEKKELKKENRKSKKKGRKKNDK